MLSDNVYMYLAAAKELQSLLSSAVLVENLARKSVEWCFIPKTLILGLRSLRKTHRLNQKGVGLHACNIGELSNDFEQPLSHHLSSDANGADPITPSHLHAVWQTHGLLTLPRYIASLMKWMAQNYGEHADIRKRFKTQALLFRHFWTRWQKEYLTALCEFHCSTANSTETIRDGDIVLIVVTLFSSIPGLNGD